MIELGYEYDGDEWRLFIDCSKISLTRADENLKAINHDDAAFMYLTRNLDFSKAKLT